MWSRGQLKEKAKYALKQNYWKVVLVTLLVALIGGGVGYTYNTTLSSSSDSNAENSASGAYSDQYYDDVNSDEYWEGYWDGIWNVDPTPHSNLSDYWNGYNDGIIDGGHSGDQENIFDEYAGDGVALATFIIVFVLVLMVILVIGVVIGTALSAFFYNPLEVGTKRFLFMTLNEKAEVKEVAYAFDHSYMNVVKILFFKNLYTALWTLLFIIPGIVKSYEYAMIPYLLAENPNLTKEQAFAISKQMMAGQKGEAFVLDLSFIGWELLSACTLGILSIFYVNPYKNLTWAALYEELSLIHGRPAFHAQTGYMGYPYQSMNPYTQPYQQAVTPGANVQTDNVENYSNNTEE